mgnify:CR=1 FL=1
MIKNPASSANQNGQQPATTQAPEALGGVEARLDMLRSLMPYEAPEVVSLPLGGSPRIFPVYMGNM